MTAQPIPDIIPEIKKWLEAEHEKIQSFWLYADWRTWARYDLYVHLEKTLGASKDYIVRHGTPVWGDNATDVADITVEPSSNNKTMAPVAIRICAARVTENDTSFGNFVEAFQEDLKRIQEMTAKEVEADYQGGKVLYLGLGENQYPDQDFGELQPQSFGFGGEYGVYGYYLLFDLPANNE